MCGISRAVAAVNPDDPFLSDILSAVKVNEDAVRTLHLEQTEYLLDEDVGAGPVERHFILREQGGSYRLNVDYPNVAFPPLAAADGNGTKPYVSMDILFDGNSYRALMPQTHQVFIVPAETLESAAFRVSPVTNFRPFGDADSRRLSEYLTAAATDDGVTTSVVRDGDIATITLTYPSRVLRFTLDGTKRFSLVEFTSRMPDGTMVFARRFTDYELVDHVWLASTVEEVRNEQLPQFRDGSVLRTFRLGKVRMNEPLGMDVFNQRFPEGTRVADMVRNVRFIVPSISHELDASIAQLGEAPPEAAPETSPDAEEQAAALSAATKPSTIRDPASGGGLLLLAMIGIATATAGVVLVRRPAVTHSHRTVVFLAGAACLAGGLSCLAVAAHRSYRGVGPRLTVDSMVIDLGKVESNAPVTRQVWLANDGDAELVIDQIKRSCRCTAVTLDKKRLAPGESVALYLEYTPVRNTARPISEKILIRTNDPSQPERLVPVVGATVTLVTVEPAETYLGAVRRGTKVRTMVRLLDSEHVTIAPPRQLAVLEPGVTLVGSERIRTPPGVIVTLEVSPSADSGPWSKQVRIATGVAAAPMVTATLRGVTNDRVNPRPGIALLTGDHDAATEVVLNGLAFSVGREVQITIDPSDVRGFLNAQLYQCPYDENSSVLKLQRDLNANVTQRLSGEITVGDGANVVVVPFTILPSSASERRESPAAVK
jgi:hypothetical protein